MTFHCTIWNENQIIMIIIRELQILDYRKVKTRVTIETPFSRASL